VGTGAIANGGGLPEIYRADPQEEECRYQSSPRISWNFKLFGWGGVCVKRKKPKKEKGKKRFGVPRAFWGGLGEPFLKRGEKGGGGGEWRGENLLVLDAQDNGWAGALTSQSSGREEHHQQVRPPSVGGAGGRITSGQQDPGKGGGEPPMTIGRT